MALCGDSGNCNCNIPLGVIFRISTEIEFDQYSMYPDTFVSRYTFVSG